MEIKLSLTDTPKPKPQGALGFGRNFTDHMFVMNYTEGTGWHDARIVPYGDIPFSPAISVFHYGQETFEGMKAYKGADGSHYLFRPEMNARRLNSSNQRMCIPEIPEEDFLYALRTLLKADLDWIPEGQDSSLYIRPFCIATDPYLGLNISKTYLFMIIMCPCDSFFGGLSPVSIWIEDEFVRAVRGGTGRAKTGGNYAASMAAQLRAQRENFNQVMWLDGIERKYIEEVGAMNIFFKIGGKIVTPQLSGSILPGITRDSILTLCRDFDIETEERPITVDEIIAASQNGTLEEAFGVGTAVVVSPVCRLQYKETEIIVGNGEIGETSLKLYNALTGLQRGIGEDKHGWRMSI